jgi:AcrR family transcriptional regulator
MPTLVARQARTLETQKRLMWAMEKLSVEKGPDNVNVNELIQEAGQKNGSALQYHFKSKEGLLAAIHKSRFSQTQAKRRKMLTESLAKNNALSLRDLCHLVVGPTFQLCKSDSGHRQWVNAWGVKNAAIARPTLEEETVDKGNSLQIIKKLLKESLPHLDDSMFEDRYLNVVRFLNLSMSNQTREKAGFIGKKADLFLSNLVDMIWGLFMSEVSDETKAYLDK